MRRRLTVTCLLVGVALAVASSARTQAHAETAAKKSKSRALKPKDKKMLFETAIATLDGHPTKLKEYQGKTLLLVNVASKCGLTPQYTKLEALQKKYGPKGFSVIGFPCNQFGGQEPGTSDEIKAFCSLTYGVTFPMMEKIEVNGANRHPIYKVLTDIKDVEHKAGDITWNFEKFLVSSDGKTITRFRPKTEPDDPKLIAVIEASLPAK